MARKSFLKLILSALAAISLAFPIHAADADEPILVSADAVKILSRAKRHVYTGREKRALSLYDKALSNETYSQTDHEVFRKEKSLILLQMGRVDEAMEPLKRASFGDNAYDRRMLRLILANLALQERYQEGWDLFRLHGGKYSVDETLQYHMLLQLAGRVGTMDDVRDLLEDYLDHQPDSSFARQAIEALETSTDRGPVVYARFAPMLPPKTRRSGHCWIRARVDAQGNVESIESADCTENTFRKASVSAAERYLFFPAMKAGKPVPSLSKPFKISYVLDDGKGNIFPERK